MRRATVQALRSTARRGYARRSLPGRQYGVSTPISRNEDPTAQLRRFQRERTAQLIQPVRILESSFYFRNLATFFAGLLAAGGAYWAFNQNDSTRTALANVNTQPLTAVGHRLVDSERAAASGLSQAPVVEAEAAEATRRALVVANDQFYAGEIVGNEPLSKEVDASGRLVVEMLTPEQATAKLRQNEQSYLIGRGAGVVRYDTTQLASNNPIEDDHAERIVPRSDTSRPGTTKNDWMFWGVFDGHSGWTTSAKLRQALISFVTRELNNTYESAGNLPTPEAIDAAIKNGFNKLDYDIVHEPIKKLLKDGSRNAAAEMLAPAFSGSCALLSFYDSKNKTLRVACTGDSRAVLGRRSDNGKWAATALSEDFTGGTPSEDARLRREHPGEEFVTRNGRILGGLEPSRAFGDAIYKWSLETQKAIKERWFGRSPSSLLKTPPYVTAEPVVTTTQIMPEKGDFVVMATDGLWECLTNEEVVGLVGQWIEHNAGNGTQKSMFSSFFGNSSNLPVENHVDPKKAGKAGQRGPIRQQQYQITAGDERFALEDKNVATHLVRNALGGKDKDMFCALLTLPAPYSRRYRDDLTVEVIFFGEGSQGGDVVQNIEASNTGAGTKPKL